MSAARYGAVVMGAGPAGEVTVSRLVAQGLKVALIERELVGGECGYWACIPSKTLVRAPEIRSEAARAAGVTTPELAWPKLAAYRDQMIRHLDDSKQVQGYRDEGVDVFKGAARIARPGRVEVDDRTLETGRIVVATGSDARIPPIDGLEQTGYWTNRQATTLKEIPESIVILGGGPVGVELGQFLRRFGAEVTIVDHGGRLLSREDPAVGEMIGRTLRDEGIDVRLGIQATAVERRDGLRSVRLDDGAEVSGQELLMATGRAPRVHDIGLQSRLHEFDSHRRLGSAYGLKGSLTTQRIPSVPRDLLQDRQLLLSRLISCTPSDALEARVQRALGRRECMFALVAPSRRAMSLLAPGELRQQHRCSPRRRAPMVLMTSY